MNIHEYQAKQLLRDYGVAVPRGGVAFTVEEAANQALMRFLLGMSLFDRYFNFARGVIDTRDVTFFLLFICLFLFLTWQSLSVRKWRGIR